MSKLLDFRVNNQKKEGKIRAQLLTAATERKENLSFCHSAAS